MLNAHRFIKLSASLALLAPLSLMAATATENGHTTAHEQTSASYDATDHYEVAPAEVFEIITQLSKVWDIKALDTREIDHKLRDAQVAAKAKEYLLAERYFIEALNRPLTPMERYYALLQMAAMYQEASGSTISESTQTDAFTHYFGERKMLRDNTKGSVSNLVKAASVYEKFLTIFEDDDLAPFVNMQLGYIYRKLGANELAIERFYHVINAALNIRPANIPAYRDITNDAKQEIAETYFLQGKYKQAIEFFSRLKLLDLKNDDRQTVLFKSAYANYMTEQYDQAQSQIEKFLAEFPDSILAPESYYLLANIYTIANQPQNAVDSVLKLLSAPQIKDPRDKAIWMFWQKKAANELANEFYEQNDYMSALRIYQAMWDLDTTAEWRAPVMYQIGLCFARMEAPQKALEVFDRLVKGEFWDQEKEAELFAENQDYQPSKDVELLKELARWHAQHISWNIKAGNRLQRLLEYGEEGS